MIRFISLTTIAALSIAGCGPKIEPRLQPAHGTVKWKGGASFTGGMVELIPVGADEGGAAGEIGPDGRFQLSTWVNGKSMPGVLPGEYSISVTPPGRADQFAEPITLSGTITLTEGETLIPIEVPRQR